MINIRDGLGEDRALLKVQNCRMPFLVLRTTQYIEYLFYTISVYTSSLFSMSIVA